MAAVAEAVYDAKNARNYAWASKTPHAYENLIKGECDIVFAFHPSRRQLVAAEEAGLSLTLTPVGREAFVFFVNAGNPVSGLTGGQLRGIYSGTIGNWREVGGPDGKIAPFQRRKESGSQSRMERFMAGTGLVAPPREYEIWDMAGIVSSVARYHNYRHAIGYSFLFYVEHIVDAEGIKLLAVDGVRPCLETVRDGSYPLLDDIYAVTTENSREDAGKVVEWILSPQGQRLVRLNGYVPLAPEQ